MEKVKPAGPEVYVLEITPRPKGRPRLSRNGHAFTDAKTRLYEATLRMLLKAAWRKPPLEGPIGVGIIFYLPRPKKPKYSQPGCRPDLDNFAKAVLDAANGIVFQDDGQVVDLVVYKRYGGIPQIVFEILDPISDFSRPSVAEERPVTPSPALDPRKVH